MPERTTFDFGGPSDHMQARSSFWVSLCQFQPLAGTVQCTALAKKQAHMAVTRGAHDVVAPACGHTPIINRWQGHSLPLAYLIAC